MSKRSASQALLIIAIILSLETCTTEEIFNIAFTYSANTLIDDRERHKNTQQLAAIIMCIARSSPCLAVPILSLLRTKVVNIGLHKDLFLMDITTT